MFPSGMWRSHKSNIKAVFKLQFHATQVPSMCSFLDRLSGCSVDGKLSAVPGDIRKPTVRSEKAVIRDGGCRLDSPVYETVNFTRDPKTGNIHGPGNSAFIGEASLSFCGLCQSNRCLLSPPPYKETYLLKLKILDLDGEVEIYRRDKDELEIQTEPLALDYNI